MFSAKEIHFGCQWVSLLKAIFLNIDVENMPYTDVAWMACLNHQ